MVFPLPIAIGILVVCLLSLAGYNVINLLFPSWLPEKKNVRRNYARRLNSK